MIGHLDAALLELEALVLKGLPNSTPGLLPGVNGCRFFYGDTDEKMREKSPPYVAWYVRGAQEDAPRSQPQGVVTLVDDLTEIVARCAGFVEALGPDPRRQQVQASKVVLDHVRAAVKTLHQGYDSPLHSWSHAGLDLSDAYVALDYTFTIRAGLYLRVPDVQPDQQVPTLEIA